LLRPYFPACGTWWREHAQRLPALTGFLMFSATGVVRDLDYSSSLVCGSSELLISTLMAALDTASLPAPHKQAAPHDKHTGAITCCGPGDGTRTGGMPIPTKQPPVTITGVAPWAQPAGWKPGKGLDRVGLGLGLNGSGPIRPPMGGMGRSGFTAGSGGSAGTGKPMTVAPWAQAPGSSIGSALAKVAASKSAMARASGTAGGMGGGTSALVDGAAAACTFLRDVLDAEECSSVAAALETDATVMQSLAATAHHLAERLAAIGSNPSAHAPPTELGTPAAPVLAPSLNEDEQDVLAKALKGALVSFYTRFPSLRAGLRLKVAACLVGEVHSCQHIKASHMGLRLHALDGGVSSVCRDSCIRVT